MKKYDRDTQTKLSENKNPQYFFVYSKQTRMAVSFNKE
jgi:hypothetical protein